MSKRIDVWTHELKTANYFTTAKRAVFGNALVIGKQYDELQRLLNENMRLSARKYTLHPNLQWSERAPKPRPSLYDMRSFEKEWQRFIDLTYFGRVKLQEVLTNHYGEFQLRADPM